MATRSSKSRKSPSRKSAGKAGAKGAKSRKAGAAPALRRRAAQAPAPAAKAPAPAAKAPASAAKAPARAAATGSGSGLLELARQIVRATQDPALFDFADLYAPDAVSREATGAIARGLAELEEKLARWESMQEHTEWKPRKVLADGDTICIEWDATVRMRDGRVVPFAEIAVHEVRDGKIVSERFYYNPLALAPQAG
jgi:ketosteroid isomerase-like protein